MKRYLSIIVILIFITAVLFSGCGLLKKDQTAKVDEEKSVAVEIQKAERKEIVSRLILNGRVKPSQEIIIAPKVPGKVSSVRVDVGQRVKKGEVLFTLDEKDIRLQLSQAQAAVNVAKANYIRTKSSGSEQQLEQLKLAYSGAESAYSAAKEGYERTLQLFETGAVQKDLLDKAEAQYKASEQQYKAAKTNLELAENKGIPESIAIAEAQYKQAQSSYNLAKSQLDNLAIVSPIDGIVSARNVDAGELAGSAGAAMIIVDISEVTVDVNVTESIINRISLGDKVGINIPSLNNTFEGEITAISPSADARLQSYPVKIRLSNIQGILKGGMFAEAEFILARSENAIAVPISAVIDEQGKKSVFIVEGDIAVKKEVITGLQDNKYVEIQSGIKENDLVVIKGQDFLQDGIRVIVK